MDDRGDTATAVLAAASSLLAEVAFDDVPYRLLGDAVGVVERTVFRHFPPAAT